MLCIQWWTHFFKNWCVFQLVSNVLCKSQFFKTFKENLLLFSRFKIVALPWEAENVFISFSWHVCFDWSKPSKAKCKQRRIVIWLVEKTIFVAVFVFSHGRAWRHFFLSCYLVTPTVWNLKVYVSKIGKRKFFFDFLLHLSIETKRIAFTIPILWWGDGEIDKWRPIPRIVWRRFKKIIIHNFKSVTLVF